MHRDRADRSRFLNEILSSIITEAGVSFSPSPENKMYKIVPGLRRVRISQPAPLLFKHSDVMAATITNEVIVFHCAGRQCNVPVGLKNTPWPKGEENTLVWLKSHCVSAVAIVCMYCRVYRTILWRPDSIQNETCEKVVSAQLLPNCEDHKSG